MYHFNVTEYSRKFTFSNYYRSQNISANIQTPKPLNVKHLCQQTIFVNKHFEKNLPKWNLHKSVKKSVPKVCQLIGHQDHPNQNISKDGDQLDNGRKENESSSSSESDNEDTST